VSLFGGLTLVFGVVMGIIFTNQLRAPGKRTIPVMGLGFAILAVVSGALAVQAVVTDGFTKTVRVVEEIPYAVEVAPAISAVAEVRVEEWQARIPASYASKGSPFAGDAAAATAGRDLFRQNECADCHGETLQGDGLFSDGLQPKPVNLTDPALMNLPFMSDSYLFWRISEGGKAAPFLSAMPAWKDALTEEARWQLVAFIRSQTAEQVVDQGEQAAIAIIERGGCFACHRIEHLGRGGSIGPSWSELPEAAASRQAGLSAEAYIRNSILNPADFIVPGFEGASVMPGGFGELFTPEEIDILVAYLASLPD
jgi:mono/diheme cytochrome c family protein